jgi:hypothetical protein
MLIRQSTLQPFVYSFIHLGDGKTLNLQERSVLDDYGRRPPVLSQLGRTTGQGTRMDLHLHPHLHVKRSTLLQNRVLKCIMSQFVNFNERVEKAA